MKNKLPVIILICLVSLLIYGFFLLMEPYEETVDLGWDKNALRNPYLAIEQFSEKMGLTITSSNNFEKLKKLPPQGMVFISNASKVLTKQRVANLLEWMEQGGHLIVAAPLYDSDRPDPLLSIFNVEKHPLVDDEESTSDVKNIKLSDQLVELNEQLMNDISDTSDKDKEPPIPDDEISHLSFSGIDTKLQIHFSPESGLTHPQFYVEEGEELEGYVPNYWENSEHGTHFMQFNVGDGLLSVISDNTIWRSNRVDTLDHAYLFWLLSNENSEVVILYGANMPSIFYLIWKYASELVLAFCVWLLAWIVYRSRRFGIIRDDEKTARRSMSEHIKASADYLWRNNKADQLLELARVDVIRRLNHHFPTFSSMSRKKQILLISEHTNLVAEQVDMAINMEFIANENQFKKIINYIQKINNSL